jgi:HAD superfamily hydrolase (TIGR01509 family)
MRIKGVFFDLYGTLYLLENMDAELDEWITELHSHLRYYGAVTTHEKVLEYFHARMWHAPLPKPPNGMTIFEKRIEITCSYFGAQMPRDKIEETADALIAVWDKYAKLDPLCLPLLNTLKRQKITTAVITNYDHPRAVRGLVSKTGLTGLFSAVIISGDHGIIKPDPAIFRLALDDTKSKPEETVFIGDSEEDIIGANNSRLISVLIDRKGHGKNYGQQFTISSLQDVLKVIS